MSLINQMLRDLEHRNHSTPANHPAAAPLDIKLAQPRLGDRHRHAVLLAVCLTVGGLWLFRQYQAATPAGPAAPIVQPPPQPAAPSSVASDTAQQPAAPVSAGIEPEPEIQQALAATEPVNATPVSPADEPDKPTPPAPATPAAPSKPAAIRSEQSARKQPAQASRRAESLYRQAENSASRLMQQEYLREALQLDPRYLPARQKLLGILAREPSSLELKHFLDESLALFPDNLKFMTALAHYHVQQKNFAAALDTLERADYYTTDDSPYLALLAAAYQQQLQYAKALPIYQKLGRLQPEKAEHWLGLGICAEKLQQPAAAAQAYRQALAKNTLKQEVVDYIKQRLNALTR